MANRTGNAKIQALLAALLSSLLVVPAASGDPDFMSRHDVGIALANIIEPLAGRKLTRDEVVAVTEEFIPLLGDSECTARCVEMIQHNLARIVPVREMQGTPIDLRTRHDYISQLYFSPTQSGSLIQRLMAEADPILVVETNPQRLMTRSDVVASMNLFHFARDSGPPNARSFPNSEISAAADTLNAVYGSTQYVMPRHLPLAAEYWRGLELAWSSFDDAQRARVRSYFASRVRKPLTAELYVTLLGLSPEQAKSFYTQEYEEALFGIVARQFDVQALIEEMRGYHSLWLPR